MNNNSGDNPHRQQPSAPPGYPAIPPHLQHHLQQHHSHLHSQTRDPQLAFLLANAAASRGQKQSAGAVAGPLGAGNSTSGGGFVNPGPFGSSNERGGAPSAMSHPQSAAAQFFEEQILQRASALRAEALMQQQQSQQHSQHQQSQNPYSQQQIQIQAALQAFQQQQQLSSLNGVGSAPVSSTNSNSSSTLKTTDPHQQLLQQQQDATLLARAAALRDLGLAGAASAASGVGGTSSTLFGGAPGSSVAGGCIDRLREQLDLNALVRRSQQQQQQQQQRASFGLEQELERVRQAQQLAALSSPKLRALSGSVGGSPAVGVASALLGKVSAATAATASKAAPTAVPSDTKSARSVTAVTTAQRAATSPSLNEESNRTVANISKSIPQPPKPKVDTSQSNIVATSKRPSSPKSPTTQVEAGRTMVQESPNPRAATAASTNTAKVQTKTETAGAGAAAAAAVRCKTKEELRKNPGTVIVPCRARGMPMDHNFISAYFVISEDAKHGENLVCSYYACRNGGIKFRYCAYCMAPVAKRNFSRRHGHGMSKNRGANAIRDEDEDDGDDKSVDESETTELDKSFASNSVDLPHSLKRSNEVSAEEGKKRQRLEPNPTTSSESKDEVGEEGGVSSKRLTMWNNLLNKRPRSRHPKDLSSWLNEVLIVSDLTFPLEEVGTDMDHPHGKLLLNELPKLSVPAATPTEDEAGDSSGAPDNSDTFATNSNASSTTLDSSSKYNSINNSIVDSNTTDTVFGDKEASLTSPNEPNAAKGMVESRTENTVEATKNETAETPTPVTEASSSSVKETETQDPQTSVNTNGIDVSNFSNKTINSSSKGVKLLGKKAKLALKKSIIANEENQRKKEDEGFAGSFADWRDRKKGKLLKKGSGSLRK